MLRSFCSTLGFRTIRLGLCSVLRMHRTFSSAAFLVSSSIQVSSCRLLMNTSLISLIISSIWSTNTNNANEGRNKLFNTHTDGTLYRREYWRWEVGQKRRRKSFFINLTERRRAGKNLQQVRFKKEGRGSCWRRRSRRTRGKRRIWLSTMCIIF